LTDELELLKSKRKTSTSINIEKSNGDKNCGNDDKIPEEERRKTIFIPQVPIKSQEDKIFLT
jgi:hypothetical protein